MRMIEELPAPIPANGFLIKAELRMTPDKGVGVFAAQSIPAKTFVYKYTPHTYTEKEAAVYLESLSSLKEQKYWLEHAYGNDGKISIDYNDQCRLNHSDNPTLDYCEKTSCSFATRNIKQGEELTEDYRTFSLSPAYINLCKKYGVIEVYERDDYVK